jgi:hypothetical protein
MDGLWLFGLLAQSAAPNSSASWFEARERDTARAMSQENVEVVRQVFGYWERGD